MLSLSVHHIVTSIFPVSTLVGGHTHCRGIASLQMLSFLSEKKKKDDDDPFLVEWVFSEKEAAKENDNEVSEVQQKGNISVPTQPPLP